MRINGKTVRGPERLELRVEEANRPEDWVPHQANWKRLLAETPEASFFQTPEWLSLYWRHFGEGQRLRTLLMFDQAGLAGVLPLVVKSRATRVGTVRVLSYPLDNWGTCFAPIGPRTQQILHAGFVHLQQKPRDWDLMELDWTPETLRRPLRETFRAVGWPAQTAQTAETSYIDLGATCDEYWQSRSSRFRSNLRRQERKLAKLGAVEVVHWAANGDSTDPRWDLYDQCEGVALASWQGSSSNGNTITHDRVRGFLREVHVAATRSGAVSMHLLLVDGRPAAFAYNYVFRKCVFGLRMGYDPQLAKVGPGNVLLRHCLTNAFESGYREINMGEGDSAYKHAWRNASYPIFRMRNYSRRSLRAQAMQLQSWLKRDHRTAVGK